MEKKYLTRREVIANTLHTGGKAMFAVGLGDYLDLTQTRNEINDRVERKFLPLRAEKQQTADMTLQEPLKELLNSTTGEFKDPTAIDDAMEVIAYEKKKETVREEIEEAVGLNSPRESIDGIAIFGGLTSVFVGKIIAGTFEP